MAHVNPAFQAPRKCLSCSTTAPHRFTLKASEETNQHRSFPICLVCSKKPRRCLICDTTAPHRFRLTTPEGTECQHTNNVCSVCWQQWIESHLEFKKPEDLACAQCKNILTQKQVKAFSSAETFERYLTIQLNSCLATMPHFHFCIRCNFGQSENVESCDNVMACLECYAYQCVQCKAPEHPRLTCKENMEQLEEDRKTGLGLDAIQQEEASEQKIMETTKKCPMCKSKIEKDGGCDHMTCHNCSYEFCWPCLEDWHGRHAESCAHHARLDRETREQYARRAQVAYHAAVLAAWARGEPTP